MGSVPAITMAAQRKRILIPDFLTIYVSSFSSSQQMRFESQRAGMKQNYFQIVPFYTVVFTYDDGARV